jgi:hypothetical protein
MEMRLAQIVDRLVPACGQSIPTAPSIPKTVLKTDFERMEHLSVQR